MKLNEGRDFLSEREKTALIVHTLQTTAQVQGAAAIKSVKAANE